MHLIRCIDGDFRQAVREAVAVLRAGGVIAYPTETTYGLGCDPRHAKAVRRIKKIKGRAESKRFILVATSLKQVRSVARLPASAFKLQALHWPGPLTLVLPAAAGRGDVAVRISSHPFVLALTKAYGYPIVSTSANISGQPEARSGRAVARIFAHSLFHFPPSTFLLPDLLIDVGALPRRKPSTIVKVQDDGKIDIIRQGAIRL